jgi:ABC-type multidrug transport system ATPase subunit
MAMRQDTPISVASDSDGGLAVDVQRLVVRRGRRRVLDGISFEVPAGGFLLVGGPAGSGKSSLLQAIAGVLDREEGEVRIGGEPADAAVASRRVGAVFQRDSLLTELTVLENLLLVLMAGHQLSRRVAMLRAQVLLAQFGLVDVMNAWPARLSDALLRRALLARVLTLQPEVLLLDDILAGLDAAGRALTIRILSPPTGRTSTIIATASRPEDLLEHADGMILLPAGTPVPGAKWHEGEGAAGARTDLQAARTSLARARAE